MKKTAALMLGLAILASCGKESPPSSATGAPAAVAPVETAASPSAVHVPSKGKKGTLVFFMNPNGSPCQMQNSILNGVMSSISGTIDVQYVKTTNPADEEYFYTYGIRGLPSMIIIGADRKVVKRFSPGIQNGDTILQAVRGL